MAINTAIFHYFVCCRHWRWMTSTLSCCQTWAFAGFTWVMDRRLFSNRSLSFRTWRMRTGAAPFFPYPSPWLFFFLGFQLKIILLLFLCPILCSNNNMDLVQQESRASFHRHPLTVRCRRLQNCHGEWATPVPLLPLLRACGHRPMVLPCSVSWPSTHGWSRVT